MASTLYYQPTDAPPNVLPIEARQISALIGIPGTLNIFTGSMALYSELPQNITL